jgi:hypothetical protein
MKAILTTFAIATLALLGSAPEVQARPYHHSGSRVFVSGHRSCGTPIYSERYLIGYDHCGAPIWGVRAVRHSYHRPVAQPRYVEPCQPRYRGSSHHGHSGHRRSHSGNSIVFQGYFGH